MPRGQQVRSAQLPSAIGVPSKLAFEWRGGVDGLAEEVRCQLTQQGLLLTSSCAMSMFLLIDPKYIYT